MSELKVKALHLWTNGDQSVGIQGESAEVTAPGWLINAADMDAEDFKACLEEFRQKVREAFEVIWPNEKIFALYDFELAEENAEQGAQ